MYTLKDNIPKGPKVVGGCWSKAQLYWREWFQIRRLYGRMVGEEGKQLQFTQHTLTQLARGALLSSTQNWGRKHSSHISYGVRQLRFLMSRVPLISSKLFLHNNKHKKRWTQRLFYYSFVVNTLFERVFSSNVFMSLHREPPSNPRLWLG